LRFAGAGPDPRRLHQAAGHPRLSRREDRPHPPAVHRAGRRQRGAGRRCGHVPAAGAGVQGCAAAPVTPAPRPTRDGIPASRLQRPPGPWTTVLEALCACFPAVDRYTWRDRFARGRVLDAEGRALAITAAHRTGAVIHYFREVVDEPRIPFAETVVHA